MPRTERDTRRTLPDPPEFTPELIEEIHAEAVAVAKEIDRQTAAMECLEHEDLQIRLR